jgi:hypothetical protein
MASQYTSPSPSHYHHSENSGLEWQSAYRAALFEVQPCKLLTCVKLAEDAICKRLREMADSPEEMKERQLIFDAQALLQFLRMDAQKTLFASHSFRDAG